MTTEAQAAWWKQRLRAGYEAFNREEFDDVVELMDPDIEWHRGRLSLEGGVIRGRGGVREMFMPDVFERQRISVSDIRVNGDKILVAATFWARGRASGIELDSPPGYHVWTVRNELATKVEFFEDEQEALSAAGLAGSGSEQPLRQS